MHRMLPSCGKPAAARLQKATPEDGKSAGSSLMNRVRPGGLQPARSHGHSREKDRRFGGRRRSTKWRGYGRKVPRAKGPAGGQPAGAQTPGSEGAAAAGEMSNGMFHGCAVNEYPITKLVPSQKLKHPARRNLFALWANPNAVLRLPAVPRLRLRWTLGDMVKELNLSHVQSATMLRADEISRGNSASAFR